MQSGKKEVYAQSDFDDCCLISVIVDRDVTIDKNKMTFLQAKILDQFQMAFEFLPYDVMVSFHFQIWP